MRSTKLLWTLAATMLLVGNLTPFSKAQWGGGRGGPGGGGASLAILLNMPEVRKELNVTPDQVTTLESMRTSMQDAFGNMRGNRDMSEEQRRAAAQEAMQAWTKAAEEADAKLEGVLDPDQFDRLLGLFAQYTGGDALTQKHIVAALGLSDSEVEKIKAKKEEISQEMRSQMQGFGGPGGGDRPPRGEGGGDRPPRGEGGPGLGSDFRERIEKMRTERDEKLLALLTSEQKEKLEALKGEAFKFPEQRMGGFGGRQGGPGQGGPEGARRRPE